jgi:hypothetical protein
VEWTSLSYTPLTEFRLEVRQEGGQWQEIIVQPLQAGRIKLLNNNRKI